MGTIILFIFVLALIVLVHEYGHFIVAKKNGIRVDEFGFGFPPRLFGKQIGETLYSINLLPFGGFVRILGEDPDSDSLDYEPNRDIRSKSKLAQAAVMLAGIVSNVLLAFVMLWIGFSVGLPSIADSYDHIDGVVVENDYVFIADVIPASPADVSGVKIGDRFVSIMNEGIELSPLTPSTIADFIGSRSGDFVITLSDEQDDLKTLSIAPSLVIGDEQFQRPIIGFDLRHAATVRLPVHYAFVESIKTTARYTAFTAQGIWNLAFSALRGEGSLAGVSGPIGIAGLVGDASRQGIGSLLSLIAIISISLAVINIIPFPALDGGRLLFLIIEAIKGTPIKRSIANTMNLVGFLALLALLFFVTYHDITNLL